MLDVLQEFIDKPTIGCKVKLWLDTQDDKVITAFNLLRAKEGLNNTDLYNKITATQELPFKFTTFKNHMQGKCTCPKN